MAARAGSASARKWLASLFGEAETVAAAATKTPKSVAKERLQIILAHQRGSQVLAGVDLHALQQELLACVQRHIQVANGANINIAVKSEGQLDIFEMQVPVDGSTLAARSRSAAP
ncbi:hypothetical protein PybrP1_008245 [[Pythium] brassicae (nom. inval.)]|nr:hypothetical protein PybrP1_008245 [[Pythium] brassicae (nom. inval.)]